MPTYYVEDYEALTGTVPDGSPLTETKIVEAPAPKAVKAPKTAEVK